MGKAPGKHYRKGISTKQIFKMFPDDETAEAWFVKQRWPVGVCCPYCGSLNVQTGAKHKSMPYRCREKECAKRFSAKTRTVMEGSKIGFQDWMIATYMFTTSLKSVSSMKLHREFGITQKSAWFMAHRLRKALEADGHMFTGPLEIDETYVGGRERNKHGDKKLKAGRGGVGKDIIVGIKDRATNEIRAKVVDDTTQETLHAFIGENVAEDAEKFTDEHRAYRGLKNHKAVNHSLGKWVNEQAHTNGMESFWAMFKKGFHGTFHRMSRKHLHRYVAEFSGRHNIRPMDTLDQIIAMSDGMNGKRLRYKDLTAPTLKRSPQGLYLF